MSLEVFMSDIHFPEQDPLAWGLALKITKKLKPDLIWLGGDIIDFEPVSRYMKPPEVELLLQEELDVGIRELRRLRKAAPDARLVYQTGNHEERLTKYIWTKARALSTLRALDLPTLLELNAIDCEFIDDYRAQPVGKLFHIHGHLGPGGSVNAARGKVLKFNENIIFGHHHKHQVEYRRDLGGRTIGAWANGCLRRLDPPYDPCPQWTQGISVVRYTKGGVFHVNQHVFFPTPDGRGLACVVDGQMMEYRS